MPPHKEGNGVKVEKIYIGPKAFALIMSLLSSGGAFLLAHQTSPAADVSDATSQASKAVTLAQEADKKAEIATVRVNTLEQRILETNQRVSENNQRLEQTNRSLAETSATMNQLLMLLQSQSRNGK